ncbi:MAG: FHA domain-containing protein [Planctomycetaceae bacterium]
MLHVELKVLEGRQQGKTISLNVRQFLIGREQDCHLRPNSDLVSRHHCVFTVDDFTVRLRDLGSTNGTFVNGDRIQGQVVLKPGDHVVVGKLSFELVVHEGARVPVGVGAPPAPPDSSASILLPPEPVHLPESSETAALNASETVEIPIPQPGDDTAVIPSFPQGTQPSAYPPGYMPQMGYGAPAYNMLPGYPMPAGYGAPGYAQVPGYPPAGYAMPPGYGAPVPYGMQPMMPAMPGYGMPAQPAAPERSVEVPEVVLPDPSTTGAKAPEAPPTPAPATGEAAAPAASAAAKKPSDAAADIIRMHRTRRT